MRLFVIALGVFLALAPLRASAASAWHPKQTYALLIGLLEWQDKDLDSFPKENRQDRALEKALKAGGVPGDHIVFLEDRKATLAAVRASLDKLAAQAGPDSTLMIYFAGHGLRENGRTYLANYDINSSRCASTGLAVSEIGTRLAQRWSGSRLLMLVDCCHSGAVSEVVKSLGAKGKAAACLTSATASNESTGNWTFTEAVIRALQGDGQVDRNQDRRVTFDEVDAFVHDEMKYGEDQLTYAVRAGGFESDWQLADVPAARISSASSSRWKAGTYVEAHSEDKWYRARILKVEANRLRVHYVDYDADQDEWLPLSEVRPLPNTRFAAGQRVQVQYENKWYAAKILRSAEGYFHYVLYDDFEDDEAEWVTDRRLRKAR
jgi:hypothetical protein